MREAATFVDRSGIALVFPAERLPLPSLWEAVAGDRPVEWAVEREDGKKDFPPEMAKVWSWKDELAAEKLACAGKHVRGRAALVSLDVLPALYSLTGMPAHEAGFRVLDLPSLEREVAEAVLVLGPSSAPEIRRAIGYEDTGRVSRALDRLQGKLVLTKAGTVQQEHGWPATTYDVVARRYPLGRLPDVDASRAHIAFVVKPADPAALARVTGWTRAVATKALEAATT